MSADPACTVPARMACLPEAVAFIERFCSDHGISRSDSLRLSLLLEELFTNTVLHGHGGDSDAPVRIALHAGPSHLELSYEDSAPPFDPVGHHARSASDPAAGADELPIGKLGIALVVDMSERISYVREDGWNRLQLALRRQGS